MDALDLARAKARAWRADIVGSAESPDVPSAPALVSSLASRRDLELVTLEADDALLFGARAMLDRAVGAVFLADEGDAAEAAALAAHELGHLALHDGSAVCDGEDLEADDAEGAAVGVHRVDAYNARERRETQANVFARELLLPAELARRLFLAGEGAEDLAERLSIPLELVRRQLCDALLLVPGDESPEPPPVDGEEAAPGESAELGLDPSQRRAAEHTGSPLLLAAGPGTGKTRTLIARLVHLVEGGADPSSILALTFSNKAAREITDRVAETLPAAAPRLWAGTFHAFGLDLLRRHPDELPGEARELGPNPRVLDRAEAIGLLEERLPALDLRHYASLYDPAPILHDLLAAISRAKDELVDAAGYARLAAAMAENARGEDERREAERAAEVARVYAAYDQLLRERRAVDFGDLIALAVTLLESRPHVRSAVRLRHRHVLVDEYQDVNRASARLLRLLAGRGERLWVVGDARQSIYRFRGASPENIARFEEDFPGAVRLALDVNYRSRPEIVETFGAFTAAMPSTVLRGTEAAPGGDPELEAHRDDGEPPALLVAPDADAELEAVVRQAEALRRSGVPLRRQAVLCRTHGQLERVAGAFEAARVPVLHLGSFFEREEVRDLLAVLSMVVDPAGGALMRLAAHREYAVPIQDVHTAVRWLRAEELPARENLERAAELPEVSEEGRRGLLRLARDLDGLEPRHSPWRLLATYLFDRSELLRTLLDGGDALGAVALYQALAFARAGAATISPGSRGFASTRLLERVRRLVLLGEERDLRQVPSAALKLDAVRLLTLHGAKGLEFDAVHLPGWVRGALPSRFRRDRCPPPPGLVAREDQDQAGEDLERRLHDGDEACLAFVALSRARDHLRLYRHQTSGGRRRRASPFLEAIEPRLEVTVVEDGGAAADAEAPRSLPIPLVDLPPPRFDRVDLALLERCRRRYFYSRLFNLPGTRRRGALADTLRVVYDLLDHVRDRKIDAEDGDGDFGARLEEAWSRLGPARHRHAGDYRALAEAMARRLAAAVAKSSPDPPPDLSLELDGGVARFETRPDLAGAPDGAGRVLRFVRTGHGERFDPDTAAFGLTQEAARQRFGTGGVRLEVVHLGGGESTPLLLPQRRVEAHLEASEALARDVAAGRLDPEPEQRKCARCPYFFLCPALPPGELRLPSSPEAAPPKDEAPEDEAPEDETPEDEAAGHD